MKFSVKTIVITLIISAAVTAGAFYAYPIIRGETASQVTMDGTAENKAPISTEKNNSTPETSSSIALIIGSNLSENTIPSNCFDANTSHGICFGYPLLTKTLKKGDIDPEVKVIKLVLRGNAGRDADATFDQQTETELKGIQKILNVPQTGITDQETRNAFNYGYAAGQYLVHGEKMRGTPLWNLVSSTPIKITVTKKSETTNCGATNIKPGNLSCVLGFTMKNHSEHVAYVNSFFLKLNGNTDKIKNVSVWANGTMWTSNPTQLALQGYTEVVLQYPMQLEPSKSIDAQVLAQTGLDLSGTITTSLGKYSTIFQTYTLPQSISHNIAFTAVPDLGTFTYSVPANIQSSAKFSNNIISTGVLSEVGTYLISNNMTEIVSPSRLTFSVTSSDGTPYDQLFSDITLIVSAVGHHQPIAVEKVNDITFTIVPNNPVGLSPGVYIPHRLLVKPIKSNVQFKINLIAVQNIGNENGTGLPVDGYQTNVQ